MVLTVFVIEIEDHICGDHTKIQHIEEHHIPVEIAGEELSGDAAQITDIHQNQKYQALTLVGFVADGCDDVVGPGAAEADQHADL